MGPETAGADTGDKKYGDGVRLLLLPDRQKDIRALHPKGYGADETEKQVRNLVPCRFPDLFFNKVKRLKE